MHIYFVSLFPELFASFLSTSIIKKAQDKKLLDFTLINPRDFCTDTHKQIDDTVYGGGDGMLIKAQPVIDAVQSIVQSLGQNHHWAIIMVSPTQEIFVQKHAHLFAKYDTLIFICGRYEGIDHRVVTYLHDTYPHNFFVLSLGSFVTLGGETPAMVMTESIVRLIPNVIKEQGSREHESYSVKQGGHNIEHPQYTKPAEVYGYTVPDVLLSGDQYAIQQWKKNNGAG